MYIVWEMMAENRKRKIPPVAYFVLGLALIVGGGFWYLDRQARNVKPPQSVLTPEGKAYVRNLKLSGVQMKATKAYMNQMLVEVVGKITNAGDRRIKSVEINCVFSDPYGQVVLRERVPIVRERTNGLNPGETKDFRLPFDNIPESWDQKFPQMVIAQVLFE
jgi:hypothetical protein